MTDLGAIRKQVRGMKVGPTGDWINVIKNILLKMKEADLDLFILDSLAALYALSEFKNPRTDLFWVFEFIRDLKFTSLLISEVPIEKSTYSEYGVEDFLADGVISVELTPRMRKVDRNIKIAKMRATNCNNDIFTLQFKEGKFHALYGGRTPLV